MRNGRIRQLLDLVALIGVRVLDHFLGQDAGVGRHVAPMFRTLLYFVGGIRGVLVGVAQPQHVHLIEAGLG